MRSLNYTLVKGTFLSIVQENLFNFGHLSPLFKDPVSVTAGVHSTIASRILQRRRSLDFCKFGTRQVYSHSTISLVLANICLQIHYPVPFTAARHKHYIAAKYIGNPRYKKELYEV